MLDPDPFPDPYPHYINADPKPCAQANSDTEYVRAVYASSDIVFKRQSFPWLWSDWFFALTPLGRRWRHCLAVLHGFTKGVIQERKAEIIAAEKLQEEKTTTDDQDDVGMKKRMAFLDLLIQESKGGTVLSDEDIRQAGLAIKNPPKQTPPKKPPKNPLKMFFFFFFNFLIFY